MNAADILMYGNRTVMSSLDNIPESEWDTAGVCGVWSVREIMAHLTSYEQLLVEVLNGFLAGGPTPYLDQYVEMGGRFNDFQVALRKDKTGPEVLAEYKEAHAKTMELIGQIPDETRRRPGSLPWYGGEYALDDYIVYAFYGHKREHTAQINVFRDRLEAGA